MEWFPSGHFRLAIAGLYYLPIYIQTHLYTDGRRGISHWRMLVVLLSTFSASGMILNLRSHSYEMIFGTLFGAFMALSSI